MSGDSEITGYLFHWSSKRLVRPEKFDPKDGTYLVVHSDKEEPGRLKFQFVPEDNAGHFGYIQHVKSKLFVHPKGSGLDPDDDTYLILKPERHAGALFVINEENQFVVHRGGKLWLPKKGDPNPSDGTYVVVHSKQEGVLDDAARFYFGDYDGNPMSPYPEPSLTGEWKLLQAFVDPKADREFEVKYKIGRSQSTETKTHHAWSVSAEVALSYFSVGLKTKAEYSG